MWPVVVAFILVCGYKYIDNHKPSKFELKKSNGWVAYFQVALKGSEFFITGFLVAISFEFILYLSMFIVNIPAYLGAKYSKFTYANDLNLYRFATFSFFSWLVAGLTILFSVSQAAEATKKSKLPENQLKEVRDLCKKHPINSLLLDALDNNLMIQVTLKSRKVYIGLVESSSILDIDAYSESVISIIPCLSGYRDEQTLSFHEDCNYSHIYSDKKITFESEPLSLKEFRHIISMNEIESFSLFDVDTYLAFRDIKNNKT